MVKQIDCNRPVSVYYNLHRKCYSIQQGGIVVAHASRVWLAGAKPRVQPAGQRKVRATGRKNVHAYLTGRLMFYIPHHEGPPHTPTALNRMTGLIRVSYNPYKDDTFMANGKPVERLGATFLDEAGVYTCNVVYRSPEAS